jgi:Zn-finger nucleic acid-binding protein
MSGTTQFDCPRCGIPLAMSERQGIEIDYCPQCRGVWLDRGELDKILERAETMPPASPSSVSGAPAGGWTQPANPPHAQQSQPWGGGGYQPRDRKYDGDRDEHHGSYDQRRGKKQKSWLGELFD